MGLAPARTKALFAGAAKGYDPIAQTLSFGQYRRWHRLLVAAAARHGLGRGDLAVDIATGTGLIAQDLIQATGCTVVGLDLSRDMLQAGRGRAARLGDHHRGLVRGHADFLPLRSACADALTFSYLYRYVDDPAATTATLARAVRPGGFVGMIEFHVPPRPVARHLWRLHTRLGLPVAGAIAGRGWYRVGRFLGPSIDTFWAARDVSDLVAMWQRAGLRDVQVATPSLGGGLIMTATRDEAP